MDICGETIEGGTGMEWVCISEPHGPLQLAAANGHPGREIPNHYFVVNHKTSQ